MTAGVDDTGKGDHLNGCGSACALLAQTPNAVMLNDVMVNTGWKMDRL